MPESVHTESSAGPGLLEGILPAVVSPETRRVRSKTKCWEEDLATALLVVLVPLVAFEAIFRSFGKALWYDEILTVIVSSQPHVAGIWNLLTHGVDGHPLGMYLVERVMSGLSGNERIILRLPSIAAFLCVMLCLFAFIRRRTGGLIAVISAAALLLTNLFDPFAFEARSYALMAACIAIALLCYERVDTKLGALGFAMSLAAASCFHFYAVLAFFPFGLAELTSLIAARKFRARVWLGFLAGVAPYFAFWPILREQKLLYATHFWATPTFWKFANSIGELSHMVTSFSLATYLAVFGYLLYVVFTGRIAERPRDASGAGFSLIDMALTLGFFALPMVTVAAAIVGHGGISGRYLVVANLGVSLALGVILSRLTKPAIVAAGLFVLAMFVLHEGAAWRYLLRTHEVADPMQLPYQVAAKLDVPVVVADPLGFLPDWHRASNGEKSRLFFLAEPDEQFVSAGSDTATLLLLTLKNYAPIHAPSFAEFARDHRRFLLYSTGAIDDYWPRLLLQRGYVLQAIDVSARNRNPIEDYPDLPRSIVYYVDLDKRN